MALTKIDDRGLKTPIDLLDNEKIRFGTTDNDLEIFHDGSHSIIEETGTGALKLVTNSSFQVRNDDKDTGEYLINANINGSTTLYYDGVSKVHTNASGVDIGLSNNACHLMLFDGGEARFGNGQDLTISHVHAESANYITSKNNVLYICGKTDQTAIQIVPDAATDLRYSGVKKFETTSSGAKVTGSLNTTSYIYIDNNEDLWLEDNGKIQIGNGSDLQIYHDGTHNYLNFVNGALIFRDDSTNRAYFHATDGHFLPWTNNTYDIGSVGNAWRNLVSIKASINTSASTGTAFTGGDDLVIGNSTNGTRSGISIISASNTDGGIYFGDDASTLTGQLVYHHSDDNFKIYTSNSPRVRFDSDGLKFGTDSAAANALDDYEEGTWTPIVTAGITSPTYTSNQYGYYTKVGNKVSIYFYLNLNGGTPTGATVVFGGLPFTSANNSMYVAMAGYNNISASTIDNPFPIIWPNSSTIHYYKQENTGVATVTGTVMGNGASNLWWATYLV